jgi:hypothetical protein
MSEAQHIARRTGITSPADDHQNSGWGDRHSVKESRRWRDLRDLRDLRAKRWLSRIGPYNWVMNVR